MTLQELMLFQKDFDSKHKGNFSWDRQVTDGDVEMLGFLMISLAGEMGEVANIVKKIARGDFSLTEKKAELGEEVADLFIYLLKIAYQVDIDLEKEYFAKMKKNQERFQRYEKQ